MANKNLSRRGFLKIAAAGTCGSIVHATPGLNLIKSAQAATNGDYNFLVVIGLDGGCNVFNMFPTLGPQHYLNNPTSAPNPNADNALHFNSRQMAHPTLVNVHRMIMSGEGVLVNGVGYPGHSRSHEVAQYAWKTGDTSAGQMVSDGWLNKLSCLSTSRYAAVSLSGDAQIITGGCGNARSMNGLASLTLNNYRNSLGWDEKLRADVTKMDQMTNLSMTAQEEYISESKTSAKEASETLAPIRTQTLVDVNGDEVVFPGGLGGRLEDIARFVIAQGVLQTVSAYASQGGYDTHKNELANMTNLLGNLDASIGAFERVMKGAGLWDKVLIMVCTEFGRTAVENDGSGNDHGKTWKSVLLGGCLRRGGIIGEPPTETQLKPANLQGGRVFGEWNVDHRNLFDQVTYGLMGRDVGLFQGNYDRTRLNLFRT